MTETQIKTDTQTFHSRDPRCKSPYGAVRAGTPVQLTLRPARAEGFSHATLTARLEHDGDRILTVDMPWSGLDGDRDLFCAALDTGDYVGLVWYRFELTGLDGRKKQLGEYQLTVYDAKEKISPWFGRGVTYQIFPDRFRRSRLRDPEGMVGGRWVHEDWEERPEYRPNEKGEIRNRDFFGGDLAGVVEKLDYLKGLGVDTLYFNPIFEAAENHRYGTADYDKIDPLLGTMEDFTTLCEQAHQRGMRVMLDGVFNHTGYVSRYFNADGFYPDTGACQSQDSPYYPWFNFKHWPDKYESWWDIYSLPAVNEHCPSYREFIFGGRDSVVRRWLRAGADGWRLDVADELPDDFVHGIHTAARKEKRDAIVIGEVWEDGTTKIAYGVRRRHLLGGHCDGLMNYPLRRAILDYFQGGAAEDFRESMEVLQENYPPQAFYCSMNSLGTHDTPRALTLLGMGSDCKDRPREWRANYRMTPEQLRRGRDRLQAAELLLYAFPGSPMVYYGDEAGMEGFEDPFNRNTYPWGREDAGLVDWFRALGALRHDHPALQKGQLRYEYARGDLLAFSRVQGRDHVLVAFNAGEEEQKLELPLEGSVKVLLGEGTVQQEEESVVLTLPPRSGTALGVKLPRGKK